MSKISQFNWKIIFLITAITIFIFIFNIAQLPQFLLLDEQNSSKNFFDKFNDIQVILEDDVMISMRVSKFFLENGYTGFNLNDVSQPSTSYIFPIILSPLFAIFPDNIALLIVVLIGVVFFLMSVYLIVHNLSFINASVLTVILFFNDTTLNYLFSGWELNWQPFFILISWFYGWKIAEENDFNKINYSIIGISSAISILIRPDSIILIFPLLLWILLNKSKNKFWSIISFILLGIIFATIQYKWFGNFTPTTARLKAGDMPDLNYSFKYYINICILGGGAALLIPALAFSKIKKLKLKNNIYTFAFSAIFLHYIYCFLVSDVFEAGRMYLSSLILTIFVIVKLNNFKKDLILNTNINFSNVIICLAILLSIFEPIKINLTKKIQRTYDLPHKISPTAEHLILANYIKNNFNKNEGSIGLFYLGTASFYLNEFEIADFLGKADEDIAITKKKWGPPGHNKWNADLSLKKWNPIVVIFDASQAKISKKDNLENLKNKKKFAFIDEFNLILKKNNYQFCKPLKNLNHGLYIRKDKINKLKECNT